MGYVGSQEGNEEFNLPFAKQPGPKLPCAGATWELLERPREHKPKAGVEANAKAG